MKREDVLKIFDSATEDQITAFLNAHNKEITASKEALNEAQDKLKTAETEVTGLKGQLTQRDKDIKDLQTQVSGNEDLTKKLNDLQSKYDKDTSDLRGQIDAQKRDRASEKLFSGYEFSSDYAKKAVMAEFGEQKFTLDEKTGEYVGGKDWLESLKTSSPSAFKAADPDPDPADPAPNGDPNPRFASNTNGGKTPPTMSLSDLMKAKNENPNMKIDFSALGK